MDRNGRFGMRNPEEKEGRGRVRSQDPGLRTQMRPSLEGPAPLGRAETPGRQGVGAELP